MSRHRPSLRDRAAFGELPFDLYVVPGPRPRIGRPVKHDVTTWRVVDDWPARVPVTDAEMTFLKRGSATSATNHSDHADDVRRRLP
jgi:hypothetical protein